MVFCAVHLDRFEETWGEEEVYVVVPGAAKAAFAVLLDALPAFLPLLEQAAGGPALPECPICGAAYPRLVHHEGNGHSADPG